MSDTIYRGYDIRKGVNGYHIFKADAEVSDKTFKNEDDACNEIDHWKREAALRAASN